MAVDRLTSSCPMFQGAGGPRSRRGEIRTCQVHRVRVGAIRIYNFCAQPKVRLSLDKASLSVICSGDSINSVPHYCWGYPSLFSMFPTIEY